MATSKFTAQLHHINIQTSKHKKHQGQVNQMSIFCITLKYFDGAVLRPSSAAPGWGSCPPPLLPPSYATELHRCSHYIIIIIIISSRYVATDAQRRKPVAPANPALADRYRVLFAIKSSSRDSAVRVPLLPSHTRTVVHGPIFE